LKTARKSYPAPAVVLRNELPNSVITFFHSISFHSIPFHSIPFQKKIEHIHECVVNADLSELQSSLSRRKLSVSKDDKGFGLLHKAVFMGHKEVAEWLMEKYPETAEVRDWVSDEESGDTAKVC
jgi:trehalose-6-phosphate synthase